LLQQIQDSLARAVVKAPITLSHITPILKYLYWLKVNKHTDYKLIFLTYEVFTKVNLAIFTT